jgi:hypothetical protein
MADIVGIVGPGGEGGTFLDWSLHYLLGDSIINIILVDRTKNNIIGTLKYIIRMNPITKEGNAHKHLKTHPTEATIQECVNLFKTLNFNNKLHTMYVVPNGKSYHEFESYQLLTRHIVTTTTGLKFIHMYYPDNLLEDLIHRIHTKIPGISSNLDDIRSRVFCEANHKNKIIDDPNVYSLNINDMFYKLDTEIHKIFSWLNLSIQENKYDNWLATYKKWQLAQEFKMM